MLKINVEGFETEVINGGNKVITNKELKAVIIELNGSCSKYGCVEKNINNYLLSLDFLPYFYNILNVL